MIAHFIHALVSIFAVMNPLGILPTFLALTTGFSAAEQRQIAKKLALATAGNVVNNMVAVGLAFCGVLAVTYLIFYYSFWIHKHLSQVQLNVITRLMGFLLSIIAIQMIANGLTGLFPAWARF